MLHDISHDRKGGIQQTSLNSDSPHKVMLYGMFAQNADLVIKSRFHGEAIKLRNPTITFSVTCQKQSKQTQDPHLQNLTPQPNKPSPVAPRPSPLISLAQSDFRRTFALQNFK
jgi:hypothetical protein